MPINIGEGEPFERPPAGLYPAVCCDVIDHGMVPTRNGERRRVAIRWQLDKLNSKSERYVVQRTYPNASTRDDSAMGKDLLSWRGKPFTDEERKKFDLERLLGANCQLLIVHKEKGGTVYANVETIAPPAKNHEKLAVSAYVRQVNRTPAPADPQRDVPPPGDDDLPF